MQKSPNGCGAVMHWRSRVWRVGKWAGVAAMAIVALVWTVSVPTFGNGRVQVTYRISRPTGISIIDGCFIASHSSGAPPIETRYRCKWETWSPTGGLDRSLFGLMLPRMRTGENLCVCVVPLWLPFLLISAPTAFLWYRDRRRIPAGHCRRCGYDLTKNESGRCPECGVVIKRAKQVSA